MLAAIHIRQVRTDLGPLTCAALATDDGVRLFTREGNTETDRNMVGLDAFAFLYEQIRHDSARLHLSDAGLRRNLAIAMGNSRDPRFLPHLEAMAQDPDPVVAEHTRWALARVARPPSAGPTRLLPRP